VPAGAAVAGRRPDALEPELLRAPVAARVEEMLRRFEAGDLLGSLVIAESILFETPSIGLAAVCHDEAVAALQPLLRAAPPAMDPPAEGMREGGLALLARFDGATPIVACIPRGGRERMAALRALHDLLRLGALDAIAP